MTDLFMQASEVKFPDQKYMYKKTNWTDEVNFYEKGYIARTEEYDSGLNFASKTYNKSMNKNFIFIKNGYTNNQEIEKYFKKIAKRFTQIQIDEKKMNGMPLIKNTRIPVSLIIACLKDEMTIQEICEEYKLTLEDIEKAMEYVIEILDVPYQEG